MRCRQGVGVTATRVVSAGHGAAGLEVRDSRLCINSRLPVALGAAKHGGAVDVGHACTASQLTDDCSLGRLRTCGPRRLAPQGYVVVVVARSRLISHRELQVAEHSLLAL